MAGSTKGKSDSSANDALKSSTPARIVIGRAGTRPPIQSWLNFRKDHALARDAVKSEFTKEFLDFATASGFPVIQSTAIDKRDFILNPPRGKRTDEATLANLKRLCPKGKTVQIVISDGLSALAVEENVPDLLKMVTDGLELEGITCGLPVVVKFGRVAVADQITHALDSRVAVNLVGERPGLSAADSLSAYITLNAGPNTISSDRTVVSNIHARGTPAVEAGAYIVQLVKRILELNVSGVEFQKLS